MPGYIKAVLRKFEHPEPSYPEHARHALNPPVYGANPILLPPREITQVQQLGEILLFYARAVDPTLVMPVNVPASEQTKATAATADKVIKLINYCATYLEANLRYHTSDMRLNIHSNASYLSEREAKNRAEGFFF
jgi:hypothetical protein